MGGASSAPARAEQALLRGGYSWYLKWCSRREQVPKISIYTQDVPIGDSQHIHTVEYVKEDDRPPTDDQDNNDDPPLVCMHGFGTGVGIYYAALPALADRWRGRVIAIDTLGCGQSSRPRWELGHGEACNVADAEDFFVGGLERWRVAMKIDRMVLMGHSLGGYLAVAYAERYPKHVDRLVLVSAVGTPEPPSELVERHENAPFPFSLLLSLWADGWSPFTVAKLGLADAILSRYVHARFSNASWVLKEPLKQYLIGTWTGGNNSAGGYAHATLLRPGGLGELAYAREPMGTTRIPGLPDGLRISAIYGERDWMDWRHMARVRANLTIRRARREGSGPTIEILHVANANHNVQVDNPLGFVDAVIATCRRRGARGDGTNSPDGKMYGEQYWPEDRAVVGGSSQGTTGG